MSAPKYGHWDISLVGRFDPEEHLGFVYQITHIETGKSYIGCKHLWKFKKRKKVKASEWRYYCSSSNYLKPDIKKYGKRSFKFEILMLCPNKRDLYYNEAKIQMELGVLESEDYYNANVGGKRFFRPVSSYMNDSIREKLSGTKNGRYGGTFYLYFEDGTVKKVENKTVSQYCKCNDLCRRTLYRLRQGTRKKPYKGIIKLEDEHERS